MHRKKTITNSDVTTSTKVLCRAARIAETITAGRPTYIKFTQAVNKTTPNQSNPRKPKTTHTEAKQIGSRYAAMDFYAKSTFLVQKGRALGSRDPISKFWDPYNF